MAICKECLEEVEENDIEADGICSECFAERMLEAQIQEEEYLESLKEEDHEE